MVTMSGSKYNILTDFVENTDVERTKTEFSEFFKSLVAYKNEYYRCKGFVDRYPANVPLPQQCGITRSELKKCSVLIHKCESLIEKTLSSSKDETAKVKKVNVASDFNLSFFHNDFIDFLINDPKMKQIRVIERSGKSDELVQTNKYLVDYLHVFKRNYISDLIKENKMTTLLDQKTDFYIGSSSIMSKLFNILIKVNNLQHEFNGQFIKLDDNGFIKTKLPETKDIPSQTLGELFRDSRLSKEKVEALEHVKNDRVSRYHIVQRIKSIYTVEDEEFMSQCLDMNNTINSVLKQLYSQKTKTHNSERPKRQEMVTDRLREFDEKNAKIKETPDYVRLREDHKHKLETEFKNQSIQWERSQKNNSLKDNISSYYRETMMQISNGEMDELFDEDQRDLAHLVCILRVQLNDEKKLCDFVSEYLDKNGKNVFNSSNSNITTSSAAPAPKKLIRAKK